MKITERGHNSLVIEKDDNDREDFTIGCMFLNKTKPKVGIFVPLQSFEVYRASEYIYTDNVLILYFKESPAPELVEGVHVGIKVSNDWYEINYENSRNQ